MGTSYKADNLLRGDDLIINNFFVLRFALLPSERTSQYMLSATHTQKTPKPFDPSQECNTETCSIKACCVWERALKALQSTPVYQGQPPKLVCTLDTLILPPPGFFPFLLPGPERRLGIRFGLGSGGAVGIVRVKMAHAEPRGCQGRAGTSNREAQSEDHEGVSGMEQD